MWPCWKLASPFWGLCAAWCSLGSVSLGPPWVFSSSEFAGWWFVCVVFLVEVCSWLVWMMSINQVSILYYCNHWNPCFPSWKASEIWRESSLSHLPSLSSRWCSSLTSGPVYMEVHTSNHQLGSRCAFISATWLGMVWSSFKWQSVGVFVGLQHRTSPTLRMTFNTIRNKQARRFPKLCLSSIFPQSLSTDWGRRDEHYLPVYVLGHALQEAAKHYTTS